MSDRSSDDEKPNHLSSENARSEQNENLPIRWSIVFMIVLLSVLVSNQVWERVQDYRAQKAIEHWSDEAERALLEAQRELESARIRTQAEQAAKQQQLRQARADSSRGKWLAKNCTDWRRANDELHTRTTAEEMRRHCAIYERYLATGR